MNYLSLLLVFLLVSCGDQSDKDLIPEGHTQIDFRSALMAATDDLPGGIMVYAVSENGLGTRGAEFFSDKNNNAADGPLKSIPNGEWKFYAIGFGDESDPLANNAYCALGNGGNTVSLSGGTQSITFNLSTSNCGTNSIFAPDVYKSSNTIYSANLRACLSNSFSSITTGGSSNCNGETFADKILVFGFPEFPINDYLLINGNTFNFSIKNITSTTVLKCVSLGSSNNVALGSLPLGNTTNFPIDSPFFFVISMMDGECSNIAGATEEQTVVLPRGIIEGNSQGSSVSASSKVKVFSNSSTSEIFFNTGVSGI